MNQGKPNHKQKNKKNDLAAHVQKNATVDLDIEDLAYGGNGLAREEGLVVFVRNAVPGDRVRVRVTRRKKNHAEAKLIEVLKPSPDRIDPRCPLFGECGGCTWQNLPYEQQLIHKQKQAESTVAHLSGAKPENILPIIPSPVEFRYRNKMDFTFGSDDEGQPIIGFHRPRQFSHILSVSACYLQPEPFDGMLTGIIEWARKHGLKSYDPFGHGGFLRHFIIRHSVETDEAIVLLLTSKGDLPDREGLIEVLREACPNLKGFVWGLNAGLADIARQDTELWRWGEPMLDETLDRYHFRVSPLSFFQVNSRAAVKLYDVVREFLGGDPERTRLLDAYCGTGTIGLYCSEQVKELVGIEVVRDAIWDARENAKTNGVDNCTFLSGDMRRVLPLAAETGPFHRIIMDPPRGGMDKRALAGLIELDAPVMVYVSCNPSTLARDLQTLADAGYRATHMQPVDLFPQTYHIETVVRLEKSTGA